eukprot:TRINITY_DN805_c0_g1_i1.p1 TRINITY_DN805_c0_g1~~TRINITY_DN805_c0_g1_i1.p1  ORF type:complete len:670 (-),score=235.20 TRINITY_DN805_c0_g1_i1:43-2052(-)
MFALLLSVLCVLQAVSAQSTLYYKSLAGPPEEFNQYILPTPSQNAITQRSANFPFKMTPSSSLTSNVMSYTQTLLVDSDTMWGLSFYSPDADVLSITLLDPSGNSVDLDSHAHSGDFPLGDGSTTVPGNTYMFEYPTVGKYTFTVEAQDPSSIKSADGSVNGYIILWNDNPLQSYTYINTYQLHKGNKIGLVSMACNSTVSVAEMKGGSRPEALRESVKAAEMYVVFPDGKTAATKMHDDGLEGDEAADDGIYTALVTATEEGQYVLSASLSGTSPAGVEYIRTTEQVVSVISPSLTLSGSATAVMTSTTRATIALGVTAPSSSKYRVYAEVWGQDKETQQEVAICWIGGLADSSDNTLPVELDLNWVSKAGASEPYTLKNIVVQDPDTFVPVAQAASINVQSADMDNIMDKVAHLLIGKNGPISIEMMEGVKPAHLSINGSDAETPKVLLVHGYCSALNPWSVYQSDWTSAEVFLNANANLGHDAFAVKVLEWAAANKWTTWAFVGHSQGGAVGLQIKNYYHSGMDNLPSGARKLQTVGTPYMGCSAAGTAAGLGKAFGVGCGQNTDLTKDGAALWFAGIRAAAAKEAYYYTTTYEQGKFFGDYCNLATNAVLNWPNDGIAEYDWAQLTGGNNMGNTQKWCHSTDMKYTAQTQDRTRIAEMNKKSRNL